MQIKIKARCQLPDFADNDRELLRLNASIGQLLFDDARSLDDGL